MNAQFKKTRQFFKQISLAAAIFLPSITMAHEYYTASFVIVHPWTAPSGPDEKDAVIYMKFDEISANDKLISATSQFAERAELHEAIPAEGVAKSKKLKEIAIEKNSSIELHDKGSYIKLIGLKQKFEFGRSYPMTLVFEKSGPVPVMISIGSH
jgi:periplasmic copper chaperone A